MYRLVVVTLTILSVSESGASSGLEPESSTYAVNSRDKGIGSEAWRGTPLESASKLLVAGSLAQGSSIPGDEETDAMFELLRAFAELKQIKKGTSTHGDVCWTRYLDKLIEFEKLMDEALGGRLKEIDLGHGLFIVKEFSEISKQFFAYCMPKIKKEFDAKSNNPKFMKQFDRMREFEIFIDEQKAAQPQGSPRYCNDDIQKFDLKTFLTLASKVGIEAEQNPLITRNNFSYFGAEEREIIMRALFGSTCYDMDFYVFADHMNFIMSAKRSAKFNREWNLIFDCGEKIGRYQLCMAAEGKFWSLNDDKFHKSLLNENIVRFRQ